jgi:hypothetical protein
LTSCNSQLLATAKKISKAYEDKYIDKEHSKKSNTQERFQQTVNVISEYFNQVSDNNERIFEILNENYSLIDPEDVDIFAQFITDYTRYRTEHDKSEVKIPYAIYSLVGELTYNMSPKFVDTVETRFYSKKAELKDLLK